MKKIEMKIVLRHATLCIAVAFFIPLFCMDGPENKDVVWMPSTKMAQAVSFLIMQRLDLFDHHMICSLGITKECDRVLRKTAKQIRRCFVERWPGRIADEKDTDKQLIMLHKYGTACAKMEILDSGNVIFDVEELLCEGSYHAHHGLMTYVHNYIDCVRPKFNENGDYCYYALDSTHNQGLCMVEFTHLLKHSTTHRRPIDMCIYKNSSTMSYINLIDFLSFPVFLNACIKHLDIFGANKVCYLRKVRLPDDYKKCIPHDQCKYKSYAELPDWWQEAIDKRYREQKK